MIFGNTLREGVRFEAISYDVEHENQFDIVDQFLRWIRIFEMDQDF